MIKSGELTHYRRDRYTDILKFNAQFTSRITHNQMKAKDIKIKTNSNTVRINPQTLTWVFICIFIYIQVKTRGLGNQQGKKYPESLNVICTKTIWTICRSWATGGLHTRAGNDLIEQKCGTNILENWNSQEQLIKSHKVQHKGNQNLQT